MLAFDSVNLAQGMPGTDLSDNHQLVLLLRKLCAQHCHLSDMYATNA